MLWTIAVVLVILWMVGLVSSYSAGDSHCGDTHQSYRRAKASVTYGRRRTCANPFFQPLTKGVQK